jgi:TRAP-type C4-dicarboxylate transport system substrate-binding protein
MKTFRNLLVVLLMLLAFSPLFAQRRMPPIRLASLVPENTPWGAAINRMAAEWARVTNNEVQVIVFHGATMGDESEVLRKMRLNDIQAAVFTSVGISSITPEVMSVSYPFLIRNNEELNEVMTKIKPQLDSRLQQSGYIPLAWAQAGWIKIFSKAPILVPSDLRKIKLATGAEEEMLQAFRIMGYNMIPVNISQVLSDLNSGRIDAVYQSPVYVAGAQIFGVASNMMEINVAPFMGGILMNETAWRRVPDKYKPELLAVCRKMEREIEASIINLETEAVTTMSKYGLKVNQLTPAQRQEWYDDTAKYESRLVGPIFNKDYYSRITSILADYRKGR